MKLSVIIPFKDRLSLVHDCLSSLEKQKTEQHFEVILIDDGSHDKIDVSQYDFNLRLIQIKAQGQAKARNEGIKEAKGEYILFLDSDVMANPDLIKEHLSWHEHNPGCAILGGIKFPSGSDPDLITRISDLAGYFDNYEHGKKLSFIQFLTCNISVRASLVRSVGGFSDKFTCYGYEDIELGYRLVRRFGIRVIYNENAFGYHLNSRDLNGLSVQQESLGISQVTLKCMHPEIEHFIKLDIGTALEFMERNIIRDVLFKKKQLRERISNHLSREMSLNEHELRKYCWMCRLSGINTAVSAKVTDPENSKALSAKISDSMAFNDTALMTSYLRINGSVRLVILPDTVVNRYRAARNFLQFMPDDTEQIVIGNPGTSDSKIAVPVIGKGKNWDFTGCRGIVKQVYLLPRISLCLKGKFLAIASIIKLPVHTYRFLRKDYCIADALVFPILDKIVFFLRVFR